MTIGDTLRLSQGFLGSGFPTWSIGHLQRCQAMDVYISFSQKLLVMLRFHKADTSEEPVKNDCSALATFAAGERLVLLARRAHRNELSLFRSRQNLLLKQLSQMSGEHVLVLWKTVCKALDSRCKPALAVSLVSAFPAGGIVVVRADGTFGILPYGHQAFNLMP